MNCVIGTAGHIDHGKTSLVRALTGMDTDRLKEEKRRGVSIDLGFAFMDLDVEGGAPVRAAIVDVPGHERFIRNMLAGATGIDSVIFAVAADDGVMPQTREHLDIIRLLGIEDGVFAITKTDLVEKGRIEEVAGEIRALASGTPAASFQFVPVSTVTGAGITELKSVIRQSLLKPGRRRNGGFFRLPVDRSFPVKGFGAVATGTIVSGSVKRSDEVLTFPAGTGVKVRGIQSLYRDTEEASAGARAAVNLSNISHNDIVRGDLLISRGLKAYTERASGKGRFYADCVFEFLKEIRPLKDRSEVKVHHLTDETLATLRISGSKGIAAGSTVYGRLALKKTLLMLRGDRFILRDPSLNVTIGGGRVLLPYPFKGLLRPFSDSPRSNDSAALLDSILAGGAGVDAGRAALMLNCREEELGAFPGFSISGRFAVRVEAFGRLKKDMIKEVSAHHARNPLEPGMREDALYAVLKGLSGGRGRTDREEVMREAVSVLIKDGALAREGVMLKLPAHRPGPAGKDSRMEEALLKLVARGFASTLKEEILKLPFGKGEIEKVLSYLMRSGRVVRLKEDTYISGEAVAEARARLEAHFKSNGTIKASDFRDLLGCGRKLAIEILEHFDRERITLRQGDLRTLRR